MATAANAVMMVLKKVLFVDITKQPRAYDDVGPILPLSSAQSLCDSRRPRRTSRTCVRGADLLIVVGTDSVVSADEKPELFGDRGARAVTGGAGGYDTTRAGLLKDRKGNKTWPSPRKSFYQVPYHTGSGHQNPSSRSMVGLTTLSPFLCALWQRVWFLWA